MRALGEFMGMTAALSPWRVAVIDSMDESNKEASNALLKMLEEPPTNTLFFLVSHAPGRLLPTIRSRCRRLHFDALDDDAMTSILEARSPGLSAAERKRVVDMSFGSAGRALAFAELGLAKLEEAAIAILRDGDPTNARRGRACERARQEGVGRALCRFPRACAVADRSRSARLRGASLERALDAYAKTRELAAVAPRVSLDPAATVFQIGGFLADIAGRLP